MVPSRKWMKAWFKRSMDGIAEENGAGVGVDTVIVGLVMMMILDTATGLARRSSPSPSSMTTTTMAVGIIVASNADTTRIGSETHGRSAMAALIIFCCLSR